jgi:two-component system chemotaxis response regulator CheB
VSERGRIRVLVIDDSPYSRRMIVRMLEDSPLVEVVGDAEDGEEALRRTFELRPDLVTLDLEMPRMDGFTFLRLVMSHQPTPIMVISRRCGGEHVFKALELGAVDFIAKPGAPGSDDLEGIRQELIRKVHAIRELRIDKVRQHIQVQPPRPVPQPSPASSPARAACDLRVVAIGASTGGPAAIMRILSSFASAPAFGVVIAQHMPEGFTAGFAERIDRMTPFRAREARDGDEVAAGRVLVAPGGSHLVFEAAARGRRVVRIVPRREDDKYAPSVDRMFESAAKHFGASLLAVVLTGMGDDGRTGVVCVDAAGGSVIAESEESAVVYGMPRQAVRTGVVDAVLPLWAIAGALSEGVSAKGSGASGGRR